MIFSSVGCNKNSYRENDSFLEIKVDGFRPYDYTVEVTNRFKGLDLIECLMNYGQRFITLNRRW